MSSINQKGNIAVNEEKRTNKTSPAQNNESPTIPYFKWAAREWRGKMIVTLAAEITLEGTKSSLSPCYICLWCSSWNSAAFGKKIFANTDPAFPWVTLSLFTVLLLCYWTNPWIPLSSPFYSQMQYSAPTSSFQKLTHNITHQHPSSKAHLG